MVKTRYITPGAGIRTNVFVRTVPHDSDGHVDRHHTERSVQVGRSIASRRSPRGTSRHERHKTKWLDDHYLHG